MCRLLDICVAVVAMPFMLVIGALCALVIRLETSGNPLFVQTRVGRDRQPFNLLKLRTMYHETGDHPSHNVAVARITKVGRVLRKTKLDELPQIWNILRGDMSFVGPRPCLPIQSELIAQRAARGVYAVRPGVTGPAQLAGIDMSTPIRLAEADADYVRNRSLRLDLCFIAMTILGRGAGDAVGKVDRVPS